MRRACWLTIPLAISAAGAAAQAVEPETGDVICVGGPQWRPSLADVVAIAAEPVPASYRALFESRAPCVRWALDEASLVDWHLRFGTEGSVTPALGYLARDYLRGEPSPDRYSIELERAWRTAQRDLTRAAAITQPEGFSYSVQSRFTEASRTIQRLEALVGTREKYIFLAEQHLRAAEEFDSLALLDAAERYLRPAVAGGDFLAPRETLPPVEGIVFFNLHIFRTDDFEMRAAVLRARLATSPETIARAETVVQAKARPHYARLAEQAFSGGEDFCDISEGANDREALEAACAQDEDALHERVANHVTARAMLDLVARPEGERGWRNSHAVAVRLLGLERLPDRGRCCRRSAIDDLVRLRLASAESRRRLFARAAARPDRWATQRHWTDALGDLQEAERLVPPFEAPARFRRIAEAWLEIWGQGPALLPREAEGTLPPTELPELRRYASYLRSQLAALEAVATGADPGLPAAPN